MSLWTFLSLLRSPGSVCILASSAFSLPVLTLLLTPWPLSSCLLISFCSSCAHPPCSSPGHTLAMPVLPRVSLGVGLACLLFCELS